MAANFRDWTAGTRVERGVWNNPVPDDGPAIVPDKTLTPLVRIDRDEYRTR